MSAQQQNAAVARREWKKMDAALSKIPPRSPELNPIENFFNLVSIRLAHEAIEKEIKKKGFNEFCNRVTKCMLGFDRRQTDAIIDTMNKRLEMIIALKGQPLKYWKRLLSLGMNTVGSWNTRGRVVSGTR